MENEYFSDDFFESNSDDIFKEESVEIKEDKKVSMSILDNYSDELTAKTYVTKNSVNVRTGDGTSYDKITHLEKNVSLTVVTDKNGEPSISSNGWYAIYIMGKIGWLSGNYVKQNV